MPSNQISETDCNEYKHLEILYNWCVDVGEVTYFTNNLNFIYKYELKDKVKLKKKLLII